IGQGSQKGFGLPSVNDSGQFRFVLPSGDCYDIVFTPPADQHLQPVLITNICGPQDLDVVYHQGMAIQGWVKDTAGKGIPGVGIWCFDPATGGFGLASTLAQPAGYYAGSLPQGTFDCQFNPPPASGTAAKTIVNIQQPSQNVDVVLDPG